MQRKKEIEYIYLMGKNPQYIYQDSKLLVPVVCLDELVLTGLWAVWAEQFQFLHRPTRKESNYQREQVGKVLLSNIFN